MKSVNLQNTTAVLSDSSDFQNMTATVCETSFQKPKPKEILYRNYKHFDIDTFKNILRLKLQSIKSRKFFE